MNTDLTSIVGTCPRGKRRHTTSESAEMQRQSLIARRQFQGEWNRPGLELSVYKCRECAGYHVGNQR